MGRSVMLGNGHMLVGLNNNGLVHDFYYPYVGLDNLTTSRSIHHKIGVWVNGQFSWIGDGSWRMKVDFEEEALISNITAINDKLKVELTFKDFVDCKYNAFCRYINIKNNSEKDQEIRIFLHQVFQISRAGRGDTALYVPSGNYLLDYKGWCSLLIYGQNELGQPFDQFAVGIYGIEDKEGTYRDAEDGELSGNLVEHGGVDSVIRSSNHVKKGESVNISYWIVAADSQFDAEIVHHMLLQQRLEKRLDSTRQHWHDWLNVGKDKIEHIDPTYKILAKKSLLVIKSHIDRHGGIIASCDSSIYNYGRDYYSYVWPRDGAMIILPLIYLGYTHEPRKFFEFCVDTMHPAGYMMHKYQPDRSIGSTWHPLLNQHHPELAIQEDETAVVLYALGTYLKTTNDEEFVKGLYGSFIKPAASFMAGYIDNATNLPHGSYDLWEEKFGTHTYTVAITIAALNMASEMAEQFGHNEDAELWAFKAKGIQDHLGPLFNEELGYYRKSLLLQEDGGLKFDDTLDISSAYGALLLDNREENTQRLAKTFSAIEAKLFNNSPAGGVPRYEHDSYFLTREQYLGNPWIISTLWLAQYYIRENQQDKAREIITWVQSHASASSMLPEQVDPGNGKPVGVLPLIWSHAVFVETVLMLAHSKD